MGCISTKFATRAAEIHTERSLGHATEIVPMPFVVGDLAPEEYVEDAGNSLIMVDSSDSQPGPELVNDIAVFTPSEGLSAMPLSPEGEYMDSRIVENSSSDMEISTEQAPSTPGPIVSPNPGPRSFFGVLSKITNDLSEESKNEDLDELAVPPIPEQALPSESVPPIPELPVESANTTYLSAMSSKPSYPNRLGEVAAQKNLKLCMQILAFWRSGILKEKLDSLNMQLDETGRASMLVLTENEVLKARVAELERAIVVTNGVIDLTIEEKENSKPEHVSVGTETREENEGFLTPMSRCGTPTQIFLPTLADIQAKQLFSTPPKSAWEDHMRPSELLPTAPQSATISRSNSSLSKEKLREIASDLQKLSESLSARSFSKKN